MTTVTIKEGIMMIEVVKKRAVYFDFRWKRASRLKNTLAPSPALLAQLRLKLRQ